MTDKTDLNIVESLLFHAIGNCQKHVKLWTGTQSSIIMKVSEVGYKGDYYHEI